MKTLFTVIAACAAILICPGGATANTATIQSVQPWIDTVWAKERWKRGQPTAKTLRAYRVSLVRAKNDRHRNAIKRRWRKMKKAYYRHRAHRKYCRSGQVFEGRISWFSDGITASGLSAGSVAGVAINPVPGTNAWNSPLTDSWMAAARSGNPVIVLVKAVGRKIRVPIIDKGPAAWVARGIDFSGPMVDALGLSRAAFPTDSWGTARIIPEGC